MAGVVSLRTEQGLVDAVWHFRVLCASCIVYLTYHIADNILVPTLQYSSLYTSPAKPKYRHTGRDAGIQAMDGNLTVVQVLHLGNVVGQSLPSLDAGFRHPKPK